MQYVVAVWAFMGHILVTKIFRFHMTLATTDGSRYWMIPSNELPCQRMPVDLWEMSPDRKGRVANMRPIWALAEPRWAPPWSLESCYQGGAILFTK